ncbi:MAG: hypothetical protein ACLSVD_00860 [Eggerthellaceae bacterium]
MRFQPSDEAEGWRRRAAGSARHHARVRRRRTTRRRARQAARDGPDRARPRGRMRGRADDAFFVPWSASVLLGRAYRRARSWWWDSLGLSGVQASASSPGAFAARGGSRESLGLWRAQALRGPGEGAFPASGCRR